MPASLPRRVSWRPLRAWIPGCGSRAAVCVAGACLSKAGSPRLRKALYFPALAALRYNPAIAALRARSACGRQGEEADRGCGDAQAVADCLRRSEKRHALRCGGLHGRVPRREKADRNGAITGLRRLTNNTVSHLRHTERRAEERSVASGAARVIPLACLAPVH